MSTEAMKLALEALENWLEFDPENFGEVDKKAITALQKALANEALDKMAENARELGLDYEPAQRTWVGLTNEEIEQGCKESWVTEQAWQSAVWWAEAKLKEKNT